MRYSVGSGSASVGRWRPTTWYWWNLKPPCGERERERRERGGRPMKETERAGRGGRPSPRAPPRRPCPPVHGPIGWLGLPWRCMRGVKRATLATGQAPGPGRREGLDWPGRRRRRRRRHGASACARPAARPLAVRLRAVLAWSKARPVPCSPPRRLIQAARPPGAAVLPPRPSRGSPIAFACSPSLPPPSRGGRGHAGPRIPAGEGAGGGCPDPVPGAHLDAHGVGWSRACVASGKRGEKNRVGQARERKKREGGQTLFFLCRRATPHPRARRGSQGRFQASPPPARARTPLRAAPHRRVGAAPWPTPSPPALRASCGRSP